MSTQGTSRQIKQFLGGNFSRAGCFYFLGESFDTRRAVLVSWRGFFHRGFLRRECEREDVEVYLQSLWMLLRSGRQVQAGKEEKRCLRPGLG